MGETNALMVNDSILTICTDTAYFNIQRSINGTEFINVDKTNAVGNGNNKYNYTDEVANINTKAVYYRLQSIDKDGSYTYSKILPVILNIKPPTFHI